MFRNKITVDINLNLNLFNLEEPVEVSSPSIWETGVILVYLGGEVPDLLVRGSGPGEFGHLRDIPTEVSVTFWAGEENSQWDDGVTSYWVRKVTPKPVPDRPGWVEVNVYGHGH